MTLGLTVAGVAVVVLLLLTFLFNLEETRGQRIFLPRTRDFFDRIVVWFSEKFFGAFMHFGAGVFRSTANYVVHQLLGFVIRVLTKFQNRLFHIQHRKKRPERELNSSDEPQTHLDAIAAHKEETSLSEAEKRKLKSH